MALQRLRSESAAAREQFCEDLQLRLGGEDQDAQVLQLLPLLLQLKSSSPDELLKVIGFFGDNQITLRGFYTDALGELVIQALELLAKCSHNTRFVEKPGLAILRALEGVVLVYLDTTQKGRVANFLHDVLSHRKIPPQALNRIESALWYLHPSPTFKKCPWPSPAAKGMDPPQALEERDFLAAADEALLAKIAAIRPTQRIRDRWALAFEKVNVVIQECFGCDGKLFGSAVNGFELATSDLDVVVPLPPSVIDALIEEKKTRGSVVFDKPLPAPTPVTKADASPGGPEEEDGLQLEEGLEEEKGQ